jgi:hypothetical protein
LSAAPVTLRFREWNGSAVEALFFRELLEKVTHRPIEIVESIANRVDIEIETRNPNNTIPSYSTRLHRFIHSHMPNGIDFTGGRYSPNQQPSGNARFRIFWTGENERPPEGAWDAYLTFDQHSYGGRNAYLPLWWITSSDLMFPTTSPFLGKPITIDEMLSPRVPESEKRDKFCVAFIGKAYPFRMHALTALSKVGKVDVFGSAARNYEESKFDIAQRYRFVFAFENDLFPGYVTEKAPEAWATGAVPLYWGSDPAGFLNQDSLINLANYRNLEEFIGVVQKVNNSQQHWESIAAQPLLSKRPKLDQVIETLRMALSPIVSNNPN